MPSLGIVAAGHPATAEAAELVLREGGNAFDAVLAGHWTACVAEPVLASLGGGGFLLAAPADAPPRVFDFFVQTPRRKRPTAELDFRPIAADFGTARQEFHIGLGAVATPGNVAGLFAAHRELGRVPMRSLVQPAIDLARRGVRLDTLQAYVLRVVAPIYLASEAARAVYAAPHAPHRVRGKGERLRQPEQADTIEALAREGPGLFYRGEIGAALARLCSEGGGHLEQDDLGAYRVAQRPPLRLGHRGARVLLTPPPSSGGVLIAFGLRLLEALTRVPFGSAAHLRRLAQVMALTSRARLEAAADAASLDLLAPELLARYRRELRGRPAAPHGTTHLSVIDRHGNTAALTLSNGEGCGSMIPGTGIMLNNMLGEEDLNPGGFHRWAPDRRMSSMMCPALVLHPDGARTALGSGGSNRIRTALLQVLSNLLDFRMDPDTAVASPRLHLERDHLNVEPGFGAEGLRALLSDYPEHTLWKAPNLFFGGVHVARHGTAGFSGGGDARRGGVVRIL